MWPAGAKISRVEEIKEGADEATQANRTGSEVEAEATNVDFHAF